MSSEMTWPDGTPVSPENAPSSMYARMLSGRMYQASDPAIARSSARGIAIAERYNATATSHESERTQLLHELLGYCGDNVTIRSPFYCDYGRHISIGEHTFINFNCQFLDTAPIVLGRDCQIAPGVQLVTAYHPIDPTARDHEWEAGSPITLGKNVWLGAGTIVIGGVTIGDNTVVGAGSVVTRDLPANVVAMGTPARAVRPISEADRLPDSAFPDGVSHP